MCSRGGKPKTHPIKNTCREQLLSKKDQDFRRGRLREGGWRDGKKKVAEGEHALPEVSKNRVAHE